MSEVQTVSVSILGKDYQISCGHEKEDALRRSAQLLDERMRQIKNNSGLLGLDRIAVMAALNLANDYLGVIDKPADVIECQAVQIQSLSHKLDQALARLKAK